METSKLGKEKRKRGKETRKENITRAERETGLLLSNAQKEATKQGNLSAKEVLKKLDSVYIYTTGMFVPMRWCIS